MSDNDNTVYYVLGGLGLLWLISRSNPATIAANQAVMAQTAALQQQQIAANAQNTNIQTGANLVNSLVSDFTGN